MALLGKFFGNTVGQGAAFAIGASTARTLNPVLQSLANEAWSKHPDMPLDLGTLALGVAQGQIPHDWAVDEAARTGFDAERFANALSAANTGPGVAEAFNLWRRGVIGEQGFRNAVRRQGLEQNWIDDLVAIKNDLLDPGQLAASIHRGLIPDPGLLKGEQPKAPFKVEAYPVYPIDAVKEAQGSGYDKDRLGVLVGLQGLPMGVIEAAHAYYRDIITRGDYIRAFNESNNRNEWAAAVLEYARQIPTARDFFENALRGYHNLAWAQKQAERHGMTPEDSLVIYQNQGRPMNIRQITQALSRGGVFEPEPGELTDPYDASVVEGNIKPAYYKLAKALKYTLPSPFVMRSMAQSGVWTEAKTAQRLKDIGWIPQDADQAAKAWASGGTAASDPHITKAQNQLWTAAHRSYLTAELSDADATTALAAVGVAAASIPDVLGLWVQEANIARKKLTPAQIKKAYDKAAKNEATGLPWTRDEAIFALQAYGYPPLEAADYLNIPSGN